MKKPKKTLKDLLRLEALLTKQTERTEKLASRRRCKGDKDNPVTNVFHARLMSRQKSALDDLSEIRRLIEDVSLKAAEADEAKHAAKHGAGKNGAGKNGEGKNGASRSGEGEGAGSRAPESEAPAPADHAAAKSSDKPASKRAPRARKPGEEAQPR